MKTVSMILFALIVLAIGLSSQTSSTCAFPGSITCVPTGQQQQQPATPSTAIGPQQTITKILALPANSFPLPTGTKTCIVTRNIAQSPGVDYNITAGAVVFIVPPSIGDVVQLNCW